MLEQKFWIRFKNNRLALSGFYFILFCLAISVFAYWIVPDNSSNANSQHISIAAIKPFSKILFIRIPGDETKSESSVFKTLLVGKKADYKEIPIKNYRFADDYIEIIEYTEMNDTTNIKRQYPLSDIVYMGCKVMKDSTLSYIINCNDGTRIVVSRDDLIKEVKEHYLVEKTFVLGTDRFGRDMLSRLVIGTRVSLSVGFISVLISLVIGLGLGVIAGYYRGMADKVIMWIINVVWSVPTLLMVLAISLVLGKGFWQVFVAVGLTMWVEVARVARGQVLSIREKEYIEAARALGYSNFRILSRHVLPNILSPVIIISASNFASAILIESGLSFLGIGVQPPIPSWGSIIKDHYGYIILDQAYLAFLPGIAIMLLVLAFTLAGNGLRDALDTKML